MKHYDVVIVGSGLSGSTIANLYAKEHKSVLLIDKREHVGGNVYDYIDPITNIRISKYGAHLFHTNDEEVWDYIQQFGKWQRWEHRVVADISGILVPIPANITTVNSLLNQNIQTEEEMKEFMKQECVSIENPKNSEEVAISRVGQRLYNQLFKDYTMKQWAKHPKELDPSVLSRIPVRTNFDPRYFNDKFQGLPIDGYTSIIESMIRSPYITLQLNTSWESIKENKEKGILNWTTLIFTGPIDTYFHSIGLPSLEYRSIKFDWTRIKTSGFYQPNSVVNYPSNSTEHTRCVEYKHFLHQTSDWTILSKETTCNLGEPYYPVPTQENRELYEKYKEFSIKEKNVHFLGRLANYKYFNMDQAVRNAIDYYNNFLNCK
jgi:UDP-galactopyranose mutase